MLLKVYATFLWMQPHTRSFSLCIKFGAARLARFDLTSIVSNIWDTVPTHKLCAANVQHKTPHCLAL